MIFEALEVWIEKTEASVLNDLCKTEILIDVWYFHTSTAGDIGVYVSWIVAAADTR